MSALEFTGRRGLDRYRRELRLGERKAWPLPDYLRESPELFGLLTPAPSKSTGTRETILLSTGFYELEPHLLVVRSTAFFETVSYVPFDPRQRPRGAVVADLDGVRTFIRRYRRLLWIHWFLPERLPGAVLFKKLSRRNGASDSRPDSSADSSRPPKTEEGT